MKKILHIPNYYYPHIGGIEQTAGDCVSALAGEDVEQRVFCFNHEKGTVTDEVNGVPVTRVGCFAKIASQSLSAHYGKELKKMMEEFDPDVVVFHHPNPFGVHYLMKCIGKTRKLVVYYHLDITKQKILRLFFRGQTSRLLDRADMIVATSMNYIEDSPYLSRRRDKCVAVPSCINEDRLRVSEETERLAEEYRREDAGKKVCFAFGRHVPYKGLTYLVRAARSLPNDYVVYIGGKGPLTDKLKREARNDKKVVFLGRLSDEELKARFMTCDVFCFPSITKNEAFGLGLAEAMYFGKPAATFTIKGSGVNYVCPNGETGIESPNRDVDAYAAALKRLCEDDELRARMGRAAHERVAENFTYAGYVPVMRKEMTVLCGGAAHEDMS